MHRAGHRAGRRGVHRAGDAVRRAGHRAGRSVRVALDGPGDDHFLTFSRIVVDSFDQIFLLIVHIIPR